MTRLWPDGDPIQVGGGSAELPGQFVWQGQTHPIATIAKRWRVHVDWWREPTHRDYFKLTTATGLLVIIYHDLSHDTWFLQRLYD
ncbi:MAG: hypothetical protein KC434_04920 [Anaerolineales bacterium]|nr:hypothetical protein [Anaerolineales bacterium]